MSTLPMAASLPMAADGAALRRSALHKNAWRMLPLLTAAFIFNYIDRTSIGFAALTMNRDLGLTATEFGYAAGILFVGYALLEVPSSVVLHRVGARRWLTRIMVTWGFAAAATALARGPWSFYLLRFLLGAAEAGFRPGVTYLLGYWFPAQYRARVMAMFMLGVPLSSVIGGPLSAWLLQLDGWLGLHGWQWMFILEGLPAVLAGFALLVFLRDRPEDANWLTADERRELLAVLAEEPRHQEKSSLRAALVDRRVLLLAAIQFGFVLGSYGIGMWLPQIIQAHGVSTVGIGWLSTLPYLAAAVGMVLWARVVDRSGRKVFHLALACLLGAAGLALSVMLDSLAFDLMGIGIAVVAISSARAIFWTIPTSFLTGAGAAGGLAFINSIGALAGFFGPTLVGMLKEATGTFTAGALAMSIVLVLSAALTSVLWVIGMKAGDPR